MSSGGMTLEEGWAIQLAYHETRGTKPPEHTDAETAAVLREILGNEAVEEILHAERQRAEGSAQ